MKNIYSICISLVILATGYSSRAQGTFGMTIDSTLTLIADTLYIDGDTKIFVNQKLIAGAATGNNGWYAAIGFKSALNWPTLLFKGVEENVNDDYKDNPQHRINDKVKMMIAPGDTFTITKIKLRGSKKRGYYYTANLKSNHPLTPQYRCNLLYALSTKELVPDKEND